MQIVFQWLPIYHPRRFDIIPIDERSMIKKLDSKAFGNAGDFLLQYARPLEKKMFEYHFGSGSAQSIIDELVKCQNDDGGFANSQEPDLRTHLSSALSTSHALRIFREYEIDKDAAPVKHAIQYLMNTFDESKKVWRIIPADSDNTPHAPWWENKGLAERFGQYLSNPRPELLGYLFDYPALSPEDFRDNILNDAISHFETLPDAISGDSLSCFLSLYESDGIEGEIRELMRNKLEKMIGATVEKRAEKWSQYCFKPLWAITSPSSDFYATNQAIVFENLDYEIANQDKDGSWNPFWSWGDTYPEAWKKAKVEWKGILTIKTLVTLKRFGRIDG
jgi:hypothetical protein